MLKSAVFAANGENVTGNASALSAPAAPGNQFAPSLAVMYVPFGMYMQTKRFGSLAAAASEWRVNMASSNGKLMMAPPVPTRNARRLSENDFGIREPPQLADEIARC